MNITNKITFLSCLVALLVTVSQASVEAPAMPNPIEKPIVQEIKYEIHDNLQNNVENQRKEESMMVDVTAYTCSYQETRKRPSDRGYGITRGGYDLRGKDWRSAKIVAIDPDVVPLHSIVKLEFLEDDYKIYNNEYLCGDTGNAIKKNKVDLFFSERDRASALDFGITKAKLTIIRKGKGEQKDE